MEAEVTTPQADRLSPGWKRTMLSSARCWIVAALAVSFVTCLIVDFEYFPHHPIFPDETRFLDDARLIAEAGRYRMEGDVAWEMPGTAIFQGLFFATSAQPLLAIRVAQALMLLLQALLCGFIAFGTFQNRRTAAIATGLTALYPFFIYFQGVALSEPLFNFLLVASTAAQILWYRRGLAIDWSLALCCVLYAAAAYTKATLTFLPPILLAATAFAGRSGLLRSVRILVLATVVYCACLTPWWARNYAILGTFVPFTTGASVNLYLGNNPANLDGGADWSKDVDRAAWDRILNLPDEITRQHAYVDAALSYMIANPGHLVENMARKFLRFWNVVPNSQDFRTPLLALISAVTFGPVLLLAIFSALRRYSPLPVAVSFYLLFAYFTLLHMLTIASLRYRLPLDSFLIVLAAEPLRRIGESAAAWLNRRMH